MVEKKIPVYSIDTDVPIPDAPDSAVPIDTLEVGDSILFPSDKRSKVQQLASKLKQRKGKVFTVRNIGENECRVWRVE